MGLLGPSLKEVFKEYAEEINCVYISGTGFKGPSVEIDYRNHRIKLDTHVVQAGNVSVTYLRASVVYNEYAPFEMKLGKKNILSPLVKVFGVKDVLTGDEIFDDRFMISASDETRVRTLFQNRNLRELMERISSITLVVRSGSGLVGIKIPDKTKAIILENKNYKKDHKVFDDMIDAVKLVLDGILEMNIADDNGCDLII